MVENWTELLEFPVRNQSVVVHLILARLIVEMKLVGGNKEVVFGMFLQIVEVL